MAGARDLRHLGAALLVLGCLWGVAALGAGEFEKMLAAVTQRWGPGVVPKFNAWRALLQHLAAVPEPERLKRINDFFNRQTRFGTDLEIWNQDDYWATPLETLGRGAGDCEDFAIAKYYSLREAGVAPVKLRLIYVRASSGAGDGLPPQAHMVLAYYTQPEAEPLILDNLVGDIRPASRRPDLTPVFSFNSEGVFTGVSAKDATPAAGTGRLSKWEDLLRRARVEGFD